MGLMGLIGALLYVLRWIFPRTCPIWVVIFVHCLVNAITRGIREGADGQDRKTALLLP